MGKPIWVWVVVFVLLLTGQAFALEKQLGGIRLGQSAIELLTNRDFLSPGFVGPVGLAISPTPMAIPAGQFAAQPVPPFVTPPMMRPGAPYPAAPAATEEYMAFELPLQAVPYGAVRQAPAPSAPYTSRPGAAPMPTYAGSAAYRPSGPVSPAAAAGAPLAGVLWLYRRPGGVFILVEMNADGKIYGVTVQGRAYGGAQTARGVRLGDSYTRILSLYGYPDSNQNEGAHFVLRYYDHGLVFRLYQMRVAVITLTSQPMAAPSPAAVQPGFARPAPVAPQLPGAPGAPPAGEEYM
jgi:hypothetical protein